MHQQRFKEAASAEKAMTNYKISQHNKLIFMQLRGEFSAKDFVSFLTQVSMDELYDQSFNSIVDLQDFKNILSMSEAQDIIELASVIRGEVPAKSAIITNSVFRKNLVNMASTLSRRKKLEVKGFTSLAEACRWLNVEETVLS